MGPFLSFQETSECQVRKLASANRASEILKAPQGAIKSPTVHDTSFLVEQINH